MTGNGRRDGEQTEASLAALPIFPLLGTVFFPHTLLPLHVFEPRFRQMTEHVLAGHQHMAVVLSDSSQQQHDPKGCARVAGLGRLVHHERLPDGRFHILLQGITRVDLVEELPMDGLLYRRVRATIARDRIRLNEAGDPGPELAEIDSEVATLRGCYGRLLESHPECKDTLGDLPLKLAEPGVIADLICAALLDEVPARQQALQEPSLLARLRLANDALATLLLRTLPAEATLLN
jgi:uncharacterized protein